MRMRMRILRTFLFSFHFFAHLLYGYLMRKGYVVYCFDIGPSDAVIEHIVFHEWSYRKGKPQPVRKIQLESALLIASRMKLNRESNLHIVINPAM